MVVKSIHQTIGAEEKKIAALVADGADLGINKLVAGAQSFLEHIPTRMTPRFAFVEFAVSLKPANVGVIITDLPYFDISAPPRVRSRPSAAGGARRCVPSASKAG